MLSLLLIFLLLAFTQASAGGIDVVSPSPFGRTGLGNGTSAYWTEDRMRAAVPRDLVIQDGFRAAAPAACPFYNETLWTNPAAYSQPPLPLVGRLFFSMLDGDYVCSGSVGNSRSVWTAGHCVYDPFQGVWGDNFLFVPQYFEGSAPWGAFSYEQAFVYSRWRLYGDLAYDYGIVRILGSFPAAIGRLTLAVNLSPSRVNYTSYGYPAEEPFDGEYDNSCHSAGCFRDPQLRPASVGISCTSTGGSSGGPWIAGNLRITSVNSYGYASQPGVMYGPYFDTNTIYFWNAVQRA